MLMNHKLWIKYIELNTYAFKIHMPKQRCFEYFVKYLVLQYFKEGGRHRVQL